MISVYDDWNKKVINQFEGRKLDTAVPIKIKPITEAVKYGSSFGYYGNQLSIETELTKVELTKILVKSLTK